jgi:hypothetical protein
VGASLLLFFLPFTGKAEAAVGFGRDIRPILNRNCVPCHGGVKRAADLSFITLESALGVRTNSSSKRGEGAGLAAGPVIVPGKPENSEVIRRITATDPKVRMPPPEHGPALEEDQIATIRTWIASGASWEPHWAFLPPRAAPAPEVRNGDWPLSDLDKFVLAKIEAAGLEPSPSADRRAWLRRVSFDLTGLPPGLQELEAFENDQGPEAYEKVVDGLLASPQFGERWASLWMDLGRYADTMGFEKDPPRTVWPWRDWLIRALNENMPFDELTVKQLAGDLLPNATMDDLVATVFHRNTQNNTEGGTDDEEYRIAAVIDRVNTTFEAWQGITLKCAQCHAHTYEPIEHAEYFQAAAFFNNAKDWDLREDYPLLNVPVELTNYPTARELDKQIRNLRTQEFEATSKLAADAAQWVQLKPTKATSDKGTQLVITPEGDVRTTGTVAHFSAFTVETEPPSIPLVTAFRLAALPVDPIKARKNPEMGFVVTRFRAVLLSEDSEREAKQLAANRQAASKDATKGEKPKEEVIPGEILLSNALGDEVEPFYETEGILRPDKHGWGALPRLFTQRQVVFVPKEPVRIPPGAKLQFRMLHDQGPGDFAALVLNRFNLSVSTNAGWGDLVKETSFQTRRQQLASLQEQRAAVKSVPVPVIAEQEPAFQRVNAVFVRGNFLDKAQEVAPGIPKVYPGTTAPVDDRLKFARWLMSTNNPLTARVTVNRVWEQLFGIGLVETVEDFGSSGEPPSHPELLDYLACRFQGTLKWDFKALLRELTLSATYRQDSAATVKNIEADPRNRLLARGPRVRLSAEMVRDQALKASGLLSGKMYGPPVMPPQPDGIWRQAYSSEKWVTATGPDRYRRAVYTYIRRTAGYPSFQTFDAPSREVCTARRLRTNTPLQALVTMNDPVYLECAVALAKRALTHSPALPERIAFAFETVTGQVPSAADVSDLSDLHASALENYRANPALSSKISNDPHLSAMAVVANTVLNLDAAMNR